MKDADAWDRAVAAEWRRCDRLGLIFSQPDAGRQDHFDCHLVCQASPKTDKRTNI